MPASSLRVAIPNKGSLADGSRRLLEESGYPVPRDPRELVVEDRTNELTFFYLRPRDIPTYVSAGTVDCGITGRDLASNVPQPPPEALSLNFGYSQLRYAVPKGSGIHDRLGLAERRIATSYKHLIERDLAGHEVTADIIVLDGAVEVAVTLGIADAIADVVQTGRTLEAAGLTVIDTPVMSSEAVLITGSAAMTAALDRFRLRIMGPVTASQFAMLEYDISEASVAEAVKITPGIEAPTIAPLRKPGWVAVRVLVERGRMHEIIEGLHHIGATGIVVTDIRTCRL